MVQLKSLKIIISNKLYWIYQQDADGILIWFSPPETDATVPLTFDMFAGRGRQHL
jgi:hypothetical protein